MLKVNRLTSGYPEKQILNHITFTAPKEKVTVIFGPNGCGKSTLLKTICGLLPMSEGEILIAAEGEKLARKITYLSQGRQVPDITVRRLVLHGRFPYLSYPRRYRKEDYEMADKAMDIMGIKELAEEPVEQLSGGQRQKVYLAMALAQDTPIVLLDEPTTYLDMKHQMQLLRQAKELTNQGKTVLMVVHDLDQAMNIADHMVLLSKGEVVDEGTPEEIFERGKIDQVFGVKVTRAKTEKGWHYFCEEE